MKTYNIIINDNSSILVAANGVEIDKDNDFANFYQGDTLVATFSFRYIAGFYVAEE